MNINELIDFLNDGITLNSKCRLQQPLDLLQALATLHVTRQIERLADATYEVAATIADKNVGISFTPTVNASCVQHKDCALPAGHEKCKTCSKGIGGVCAACHCYCPTMRDLPEHMRSNNPFGKDKQ